jgi:hypothetical protein
MAYPASTSLPARTLDQIDHRALQMKNQQQNVRNQMAAGNVPSTTIIDIYIRLRIERAAFTAAAAVPGLVQYARDQKNNQSLNVVTEFNAMIAAIDAVTNWISTNFPKDGGGFILAATLGPEGPVYRQFTPAQTAGLRTALDALIATVS